MQKYRHGLTEPNMFLMKLYGSRFEKFLQEVSHNESLCHFIEDPVHFDYRYFDERWWPLFCFSDIGMGAMKYGKASVSAAFDNLKGSDREKAEYYFGLYCGKDEPIDTDDVFFIPDHIDNPRV